MRIVARLAVVVFVAGLGLAAGVALLAPQARGLLTAGSGPGERIDLQPLSQRSVMLAADGSVLEVLHAEENRAPVPLSEVPDVVVNAILDVEDARFWTHNGVDIRGTLRALYTNVESGSLEQGGSTITQQVVKNAIVGRKKTASRKLKEALLAVRLEHQFTKKEILERYLNTVYFGNGAYGVQAAAETYFGVDVGKLRADQAALLAGMIRNPLGYDPFRNPDAALERRAFALRRMQEQGHLSEAERAFFEKMPLPAERQRVLPEPDGGGAYFAAEVRRTLLRDKRLGETFQERYDALFNGGLRIHTTLDPRWEAAARDAVAQRLPDTQGRFTAALVSVDAATGAVRALVGGDGFEQAKFNLATQGRRQAGSAFKVFTLVAALEQGISPMSTISGSSPCRIPNPGGTPDPWLPGNYEGKGGGTMTLVKATAQSINCAYARLATIVGIDKVADVARRMGIRTELDPTPAMTLGGLRNGVSPLEMASAYATLAAEGVYHAPYLVEKVEDRDGKVLFRAKKTGTRVLDPQVARLADDVLQAPVREGTATAARLPGRQVAGKTGTAQDHVDAWFVGFTPQVATAVWMGAPNAEVPMRNVGGIRVTGGSYPARIWKAFMSVALEDLPVASFTPPNPKLIPKATYLRLPGEKSSTTTKSTRPRRPAGVPARPRSTLVATTRPPATQPPATQPTAAAPSPPGGQTTGPTT